MTAGLGFHVDVANDLLDNDERLDTVYIQLHTEHPGADGTANVATEDRRVEVDLAAAVNGVRATAEDAEWIDVAATEHYKFATVWTALTDGDVVGAGELNIDPILEGADFKIDAGLGIVKLNVMGAGS